jgi:hypothetical protein
MAKHPKKLSICPINHFKSLIYLSVEGLLLWSLSSLNDHSVLKRVTNKCRFTIGCNLQIIDLSVHRRVASMELVIL